MNIFKQLAVSALSLCAQGVLGAIYNNQSVTGMPPVTISGPSPTIAPTYDAGTDTTITYTLQNNVPASFPLSVYGLSEPLSRITVSDDCGSTLPAQSSCDIGVLIAPTSDDMGNQINQNMYVNYQGRVPFVENIRFSVPIFPSITSTSSATRSSSSSGSFSASATPSPMPIAGGLSAAACGTNICIVSGYGLSSNLPFLAQSTNQGINWNVVPSGITNGQFLAADCNDPLCVTAGKNSSSPILAQSRNTGANWTQVSTGLAGSSINALSCSGSMCVGAVSSDQANTLKLTQTTNAGINWISLQTHGADFGGNMPVLYAASCVPGLCIVAGDDNDAPEVRWNILAYTTVGGASWPVMYNSGGLPDNGTLRAAAGTTGLSFAAGRRQNTNPIPLIFQTNNNGADWTMVPSEQLPPSGTFYAADCATTICIAAGYNTATPASPILAQTASSPLGTWANIGGWPTSGRFYGAGCGTGICFVVGYSGPNEATGSPMLNQTLNNGVSWTGPALSNTPSTGVLLSASCTTSNPAWCIAAGYSGLDVLLVQTLDGGGTWARKFINPSSIDLPVSMPMPSNKAVAQISALPAPSSTSSVKPMPSVIKPQPQSGGVLTFFNAIARYLQGEPAAEPKAA